MNVLTSIDRDDGPFSSVLEAWMRSGAPWQPLGMVHDGWRWVDAMTLAVNAGLEMQQALWQPWWVAQGDWLCRWTAAWPVEWPAARGKEQLA